MFYFNDGGSVDSCQSHGNLSSLYMAGQQWCKPTLESRSEGKLGQQDTEMPIWWSRMFSVLMMIKSFAIINSKRGRGRTILKKRRWTYFAGIWTLDFLPGTVHLRNRLTVALDSIRYKHDARRQLLSQLKDKSSKPTLIFPFFLTNQNAPD